MSEITIDQFARSAEQLGRFWRGAQTELALNARLSLPTVQRVGMQSDYEFRRRPDCRGIARALRSRGVEFIDENGGGPGVRLRKAAKGKSRK